VGGQHPGLPFGPASARPWYGRAARVGTGEGSMRF